ncbi:murein hydrolase activator EnvC family protein [Reinekea thalattae]|uniref:Peptidoglycan DD-metalloendopeptidase family protein n=1 Tax=Reinekea thalattae TaxID=2593301 RepID=A0A5C8ZB67_9GAMM|nr:peptidoglycan DD-metalloendopeptidase family protein [Reinekea thalattae]TXR54136.1 peptidoglycan DD-metalloendopeptidase family protein [Reinekea thalattae]
MPDLVFRFLTVVLSLLLLCPLVLADELDDNKKRLQQITQELESLQQRLANQNQGVSKQRQALTRVEKNMAQLENGLRQLRAEISQANQQLNELQQQQSELEQQQASKKSEIDAILRLAYKQNNLPLIKLILSGERPEELARQLYYFSALTKNQRDQLQQWLDRQTQLAATIEQQLQLNNQLKDNLSSQLEQTKVLAEQRKEREQLLQQLVEQSKDTQAEIAHKEAEQQRMADLVNQLQSKLNELNLDFPELEAIGKVKGKLVWPVAGRLVNQYGRAIDGTTLKWQGWLIEADFGDGVRAVHGGRVIFADFFKSSGLLIIIDHGDGVWSLYGRNNSLLKDVGSWVETGELIAEVGQSGGYNRSGLYFELRINGEPVNPSAWLGKR